MQPNPQPVTPLPATADAIRQHLEAARQMGRTLAGDYIADLRAFAERAEALSKFEDAVPVGVRESAHRLALTLIVEADAMTAAMGRVKP